MTLTVADLYLSGSLLPGVGYQVLLRRLHVVSFLRFP